MASGTVSNAGTINAFASVVGGTGNATVNSSGVVTGVAAGTAVITATSEGQSGQVTVNVRVEPNLQPGHSLHVSAPPA